jgi:hypothetical protein
MPAIPWLPGATPIPGQKTPTKPAGVLLSLAPAPAEPGALDVGVRTVVRSRPAGPRLLPAASVLFWWESLQLPPGRRRRHGGWRP